MDEILILRGYLQRTKFFAQLFEDYKQSTDIVNEICKSIKYESVKEWQILFKQGDEVAEKAYIVLTGQVMFCMKENVDVFQSRNNNSNDDDDDEDNSNNLQQSDNSDVNQQGQFKLNFKNSMILSKFVGKLVGGGQMLKQAQQKVSLKDFMRYIEKEFGKINLEMGPGDMFGEKALLENKPRAATVVTKTECEFLILEKKNFDLILNRFRKMQSKKNQFLLTMFPFLQTLISTGRIFERVVRFFNEEVVYRKQIIINEGEKYNMANARLYLVKEGEFQITKKVQKLAYSTRTLPHARVQTISLGYMGQCEFFGEEVLDNEEGEYLYTVTCVSSQGNIMMLEKTNVLKKLPEQIKDSIIQSYIPKKVSRQQIFGDQMVKIEQNQAEERQYAERRIEISEKLEKMQPKWLRRRGSNDQDDSFSDSLSQDSDSNIKNVQKQTYHFGNTVYSSKNTQQILQSLNTSMGKTSSNFNQQIKGNISSYNNNLIRQQSIKSNFNEQVNKQTHQQHQVIQQQQTSQPKPNQIQQNNNESISLDNQTQDQLSDLVNNLDNNNDNQQEIKDLLNEIGEDQQQNGKKKQQQKANDNKQQKSEDQKKDQQDEEQTQTIDEEERQWLRNNLKPFVNLELNQKLQLLNQRQFDSLHKKVDPYPFTMREVCIIKMLEDQKMNSTLFNKETDINLMLTQLKKKGNLPFNKSGVVNSQKNQQKDILNTFNKPNQLTNVVNIGRLPGIDYQTKNKGMFVERDVGQPPQQYNDNVKSKQLQLNLQDPQSKQQQKSLSPRLGFHHDQAKVHSLLLRISKTRHFSPENVISSNFKITAKSNPVLQPKALNEFKFRIEQSQDTKKVFKQQEDFFVQGAQLSSPFVYFTKNKFYQTSRSLSPSKDKGQRNIATAPTSTGTNWYNSYNPLYLQQCPTNLNVDLRVGSPICAFRQLRDQEWQGKLIQNQLQSIKVKGYCLNSQLTTNTCK